MLSICYSSQSTCKFFNLLKLDRQEEDQGRVCNKKREEENKSKWKKGRKRNIKQAESSNSNDKKPETKTKLSGEEAESFCIEALEHCSGKQSYNSLYSFSSFRALIRHYLLFKGSVSLAGLTLVSCAPLFDRA